MQFPRWPCVLSCAALGTLSIRGREPIPTASVIKLPILVELFHQMRLR